MRITRNFAEYATSDAILIGAEVDKVVSIAAVTAILAIAIVRARRLLIRAATDAYAAQQLSRFFAPAIAREITAADAGFSPGEGVMREAAVLVLDLRGFTALAARLSPGETVALLRDYHRQIVPIIQRHGGSIDKYLGDGIMATFGAARASETYAADAFRALQSVLAATRPWSTRDLEPGEVPVEVNAAITVGPVLFGVTGDATRLEFTVIGEAVNLAAKLEKHCKIAGCAALATAVARERAQDQGMDTLGDWTHLPAQAVAGLENAPDLLGYGIRDECLLRLRLL